VGEVVGGVDGEGRRVGWRRRQRLLLVVVVVVVE
jgi:hypothetical protein